MTTQTVVQPVDVPQNVTATVTSSTTTTATTSTGTTTTSDTDKKEVAKDVVVPKGKEIVPGFGVVMSMQMLNAGYNMQQEQMKEYINLIQEQEYGREQNVLLEFIGANDTGDYLFNTSAARWRGILRDNPLQRFDLDD